MVLDTLSAPEPTFIHKFCGGFVGYWRSYPECYVILVMNKEHPLFDSAICATSSRTPGQSSGTKELS